MPGERTRRNVAAFCFGSEIAGERLVHEILEIDNSQDANRRRRFLISPAQYRDAELQAEERHHDVAWLLSFASGPSCNSLGL